MNEINPWQSLPHHNLPLNLPHAGTVADRICMVLTQSAARQAELHATAFETAETLRDLLLPYRFHEENPPADLAQPVQTQAANLARRLVAEIARHKLGTNRLGQCVRNLFECLALGQEGSALGLTAGEHPHGVQRPRHKKLPPMSQSTGVLSDAATEPAEAELTPRPPEKVRIVARIDPTLATEFHLEPPGPIGLPEEGELGPPLDDADDLAVPLAPAPRQPPLPRTQRKPRSPGHGTPATREKQSKASKARKAGKSKRNLRSAEARPRKKRSPSRRPKKAVAPPHPIKAAHPVKLRPLILDPEDLADDWSFHE